MERYSLKWHGHGRYSCHGQGVQSGDRPPAAPTTSLPERATAEWRALRTVQKLLYYSLTKTHLFFFSFTSFVTKISAHCIYLSLSQGIIFLSCQLTPFICMYTTHREFFCIFYKVWVISTKFLCYLTCKEIL